MGRTIAIGDIHGCSRALEAVLHQVDPGPDDTLVFLGDYVDRGPDSAGVISTLLELKATCKTVFIKGNHEEMMLGARNDPAMWRGWNQYGGSQTLDSYGDSGRFEKVPTEHWEFLEATVSYHKTNSHIFTHAPIRPDLEVESQDSGDWRWRFDLPAHSHVSGKTVVCGHRTQQDGMPMWTKRYLLIDTWACGGLWLSAAVLEEDMVIQGNEDGEVREVPKNKWRTLR